jgi:Domain of unknown function (DUF4253)
MVTSESGATSWTPEALGAWLRADGVDLPVPVEFTTRYGVRMYGFEVGPQDHTELWRQLRARSDRLALWPFVTWEDPRGVAGLVEMGHGRGRPAPAEVIGSAVERLIGEVVGAQLNSLEAASEAWYCNPSTTLFAPETLAVWLGRAELPPRPGRTRLGDIIADPVSWLYLSPLYGYELPALLDAPYAVNWYGSKEHTLLTPADHVTFLRSWQRRYGAEVFYLASKGLELVVERPPRDWAEIARVAFEQYGYCPSLNEVVGDVDAVAREQVPTDRWTFWWD